MFSKVQKVVSQTISNPFALDMASRQKKIQIILAELQTESPDVDALKNQMAHLSHADLTYHSLINGQLTMACQLLCKLNQKPVRGCSSDRLIYRVHVQTQLILALEKHCYRLLDLVLSSPFQKTLRRLSGQEKRNIVELLQVLHQINQGHFRGVKVETYLSQIEEIFSLKDLLHDNPRFLGKQGLLFGQDSLHPVREHVPHGWMEKNKYYKLYPKKMIEHMTDLMSKDMPLPWETTVMPNGQKWPSLLMGDTACYLLSPSVEHGSYGKFRIAFNRQTKQFEAFKELRLLKTDNKQRKTKVSPLSCIAREISLMQQIHHGVGLQGLYEREKSLFLAMPLMNGSLKSVYFRLSYLHHQHVAIAWSTLLQAAQGLMELHELNYLHLDVKPSNLLFDGQGRIRLTDYGLVLSQDKQRAKPSIQGTFSYTDLAMYRNTSQVHAADLWSLAITVGEMLSLRFAPEIHGYEEYRPEAFEKAYDAYKSWYIDMAKQPKKNGLMDWGQCLLRALKSHNKDLGDFTQWLASCARHDAVLTDYLWQNMLSPWPEDRVSIQDVITFAEQQESIEPYQQSAREILQSLAKDDPRVEVKKVLQQLDQWLP